MVRDSRRPYSAGWAGASTWSKAAVGSATSVVVYGQSTVVDVAAVAGAAEAIDEVMSASQPHGGHEPTTELRRRGPRDGPQASLCGGSQGFEGGQDEIEAEDELLRRAVAGSDERRGGLVEVGELVRRKLGQEDVLDHVRELIGGVER